MYIAKVENIATCEDYGRWQFEGMKGRMDPVYGRQKLKKFLKVYSGISFGNLNTVIWVMEIIMSARPCMRNGANWSYW